MVAARLAHAIVALFACTADESSIDSALAQQSEPLDPWELRMPSIKSIDIVENSAIHDFVNNLNADCSSFVVTEAHVRLFLDRATINLPWAPPSHSTSSPCYAGGTILLEDGRTVEWWIDRGRAGQLIFEGGGAATVLDLFCSKCHSGIYAEERS